MQRRPSPRMPASNDTAGLQDSTTVWLLGYGRNNAFRVKGESCKPGCVGVCVCVCVHPSMCVFVCVCAHVSVFVFSNFGLCFSVPNSILRQNRDAGCIGSISQSSRTEKCCRQCQASGSPLNRNFSPYPLHQISCTYILGPRRKGPTSWQKGRGVRGWAKKSSFSTTKPMAIASFLSEQAGMQVY